MAIFEEEILEPVARNFRFRIGAQEIDKNNLLTLVDLGCGPDAKFYYFATHNGITIKKYIGIDPLIKKKHVRNADSASITLLKDPLIEKIPLRSNFADYIVGFAFLEHVDKPNKILIDATRILKIGGKAIFTTPTPSSKKILEVLSFKLGFISKREIAEHKHYFDKNGLLKIFSEQKGVTASHRYFELGLNNLLVLQRVN